MNHNVQMRKSQQGMTLIELMIALTILVIGMGALMVMITAAIAQNNGTKHDSQGTMLAQMVTEKVINISAINPPPALPVETDCAGTAHTIQVTGGAAPAGAGALLIPQGAAVRPGEIDFTQAFGAIPANYAMLYIACGDAGRRQTYDVRWNIQTLTANTKLITVAARRVTGTGGRSGVGFNMPVTMRTIAGL
jgi:prepilin-type N-terminal cleavage/methylation domain-containing protein